MKKNVVVIILFLLAGIFAFSWGGWNYLNKTPAEESGVRYVEILPGTSFKQISEKLEKEGIIVGSARFRVLAKLKGVAKEI